MKGKWKENSKKKKGNVVLQKYIVAVGEFVKSKSGTEEEKTEHDRGLGFVKKKSRKELRKEKRKLKKIKMKTHYEGKKFTSLPTDEGEHSEKTYNKQPQLQKIEKVKKEVSKTHSNKPTSAPTVKSKTPTSSKEGKKKMNKLQESRKMALLEANEQEDREIKKLERCLRLNKRKNKKSLPQSFVADGLDYILGVLDSGSSAVGMYDSDDDMDVAKENFEKLDKNDTQLSDEDKEPGDEMESEGSDDDMGSFDDAEEDDHDDDDEMIHEEEADDEEVINEEEADDEEMEDELDESDAADSDDENEGDTEEEADTPDTKTSGSNSGTVSSQPKYLFQYCHNIVFMYV